MSLQPFTPEPQLSSAQDYRQFNLRQLLDDPARLDPFGVEVGKGMGIAFVDPTVPEYQSLIQGINPGTQVVILDANQDGVQQITDFLLKNALMGGQYSAVHIISHGSPGSIEIGSSHLGHDNITDYTGALQQWQNVLTLDADILLYGCDVAFSDSERRTAGESFVQRLAELTGADIAASNDLTGSAALGGDWELEVKTGEIATSLAFQGDTIATYNQTFNVIINEWSQGNGGNKEWVELLVTETTDLRGWTLADDTGTFPGNIYVRFEPSPNTFWQVVPAGTLIVIYNNSDRDTALPADDLSLTDGNFRIVAPHNNTALFDPNTWGGFNNSTVTDNPILRDSSNTIIHDWDQTNNFAFNAVRPGGSQAVYYTSNSIGGVATVTNYTRVAVGSSVTAGDPNGGENTTWINSLRNTAPTASLNLPGNITTSGETTQTFTITYSDNAALNASSLDSNDIRVTGPGGYNQLATLLGFSGSGTSRTATYQITAPGGTWDVADNGTYSIAVEASQVSDFSGNFVTAGTLGTFIVNIPQPNVAPLLDLNGGAAGINHNASFTRGGGAIAIVDSNNLTLTDDGSNISSATVRITNVLNGAAEVLRAVTTNTNITASYNNGVLTLTGSDTVANYQQVLRSVAYNNTAIIPNTTSRSIEFLVSDGSLNSATATTTLAINMPTISLSSGGITPGIRLRSPVASVNNTTPDALYSFTLSTATRIVAQLAMTGGNADLALLNNNGTILASSTNFGTLSENFDRSGLLPGNYFIRVYQAIAGEAPSYRLSVNFA